jgi:hypothetical protein
LLKKLDKIPDILLVDNNCLLDVRAFSSCPVVYISRAGDSIEIKSLDAPSKKSVIPSTKFQPVAAQPARGFEHDLDQVTALLQNTFDRIDLFEPFSRISTALEMLAAEDQRFT